MRRHGGVRVTRDASTPHTQCMDCDWEATGLGTRTSTKEHVLATGHKVIITVTTRDLYQRRE